MIVNEIFASIQGEGHNLGAPSVFVRLAGCNLKCQWCDTKYAKTGKKMTPRQVVDEIVKKGNGIKNVIFTGGEPTLQLNEIHKVMGLLSSNYTYEIETNGTNPIEAYWKWDTINISPKKESINLEVLQKLAPLRRVYFKFVVEDENNLIFWESLVNKLRLKKSNRIILMSEGVTDEDLKKKAPWLIEKCKENGYRYSPRIHIWVWGKKKGV
jgi:7-carboxy-7-deazaguanine synthase